MAKKKINAIPLDREVIVIAKKEHNIIDVDIKTEEAKAKEEEKKEEE